MERRRFLQAISVLSAGLAVYALVPDAEGQDYDDPRDVYAALRQPPDLRLSVQGGTISVVIAQGAFQLDRLRMASWIQRSAVAVSTYFGRFPVDQVRLLLVPGSGDHIGPATTWGFNGSVTCVHVGHAVSDASLRNDWVMVHEMVHLALPNVPRRSEWLLEGNATYVEPIARAQAGQITPQEVWRWAVEDMPKGQPQDGDLGLDHTHTWARTYWGGAMFWLLAELSIHKKSAGRYRLQDALRAINRSSGGNTSTWSVDQVADAGDAAVHTDALASLYAQLKDRPVDIGLHDVLRQLGVSEEDGVIRFDDNAPLSRLRRSITTPRESL